MASRVPAQSGTVCLWLQLISGKTREGKQESFTVRSSLSPPSFSNILQPANWKQQAVKCVFTDLVKQDRVSLSQFQENCRANIAEKFIKAR